MLSCFSWVLWEVVRQSKKQQFTPDPVAEPPCPDFAGWTLQPWQPAHSYQLLPPEMSVGGREQGVCRPPAL